jgi:hypothetical protein
MVDPIDQDNQFIVVEPGSYAEGLNLKYKRASTEKNFPVRESLYDKLTLVAYEGSSLTLMGLVKYDKAQGCFKMTEVGGFIAGGVSEFKKMIKMQIASTKSFLVLIGVLTGICGFFTGLILYKKYKENQMKRHFE